MKQKYSLLIIIGMTCHLLNADVFILHGSFGSESRWYRPGGEFYETVAREGAALGHTTTPFLWSGGIGAKSIIEAAGALVQKLITLPADAQIILFAHSNGGNVCAYASMILGELYNNPPTDRTAPAILKKPFEEKKITKNRAFIYETPPALDSLIDATFAHLQNTIDLKHYLRRSLPDYPIQLMCLMGTPIDTARFDINMNIVKQAINLYSPADFIQAIVGKQLLPEHERRANLQTKIHHQACSTNPIDPCHKHIRNPIIGKWLLHLPKIIAEKESATTITGGTAIFYNDKEPVFMPGVYSVLDESSNSPEESETDSAEDSDADSDDATSFSIE